MQLQVLTKQLRQSPFLGHIGTSIDHYLYASETRSRSCSPEYRRLGRVLACNRARSRITSGENGTISSRLWPKVLSRAPFVFRPYQQYIPSSINNDYFSCNHSTFVFELLREYSDCIFLDKNRTT